MDIPTDENIVLLFQNADTKRLLKKQFVDLKTHHPEITYRHVLDILPPEKSKILENIIGIEQYAFNENLGALSFEKLEKHIPFLSESQLQLWNEMIRRELLPVERSNFMFVKKMCKNTEDPIYFQELWKIPKEKIYIIPNDEICMNIDDLILYLDANGGINKNPFSDSLLWKNEHELRQILDNLHISPDLRETTEKLKNMLLSPIFWKQVLENPQILAQIFFDGKTCIGD